MRCEIKEKKEEIDYGDLILYKSDGNKELCSEYRRCLVAFRNLNEKYLELLDIDCMQIIAKYECKDDLYNSDRYINMICKSRNLILTNSK